MWIQIWAVRDNGQCILALMCMPLFVSVLASADPEGGTGGPDHTPIPTKV